MLSLDNPLDFHSEMYLVLAIILTYYVMVEILNKLENHLLHQRMYLQKEQKQNSLSFMIHFQ